MSTTIRLQREAVDVAAEAAALTLEHYPGMAEAEIARHVEEAHARWPLLGVTVIHRYGRIEPGEVIVLVATASRHREAAFAAASFLMDYLKTRAPFWKQVQTVAGTAWIDAKTADDAAAERWSGPPPRREAAK
jgi:molybdopterin synthase catalytic subunit